MTCQYPGCEYERYKDHYYCVEHLNPDYLDDEDKEKPS